MQWQRIKTKTNRAKTVQGLVIESQTELISPSMSLSHYTEQISFDHFIVFKRATKRLTTTSQKTAAGTGRKRGGSVFVLSLIHI